MHFSGAGPSWRVAEGEPNALVHALYARDASSLDVAMEHPVPPISPAVPVESRFTVHATPRAAADWPGWWLSEMELGLAPAPDNPELWFAGRPIGPDLRALLIETAGPMSRWHRDRQREHMAFFVNRTPAQRMLVTHLVAEIERDLGRRAAAFELRVDVLPVHGSWGCRPAPGRVLVSRELRADDDAFRAFLEPVIRTLA